MSIKLGAAIYSILLSSSILTGYTSNKVYPLIIPENTQLPCVVYERNGDFEYTRDGVGVATSVIDITILSEDYTECINITQAVYDVLQLYKGIVSGINILDTRLIGLSETYAENAYIQKLTFSIKSI